MKKIFTLMTVAFAAVTTAFAQQNLVSNPSFEWDGNYPADWYLNDVDGEQVEGPTAGSTALQFVPQATVNDKGEINDSGEINQYVNGLSEGQTYTISFDYKVVNYTKDNSFRNWFRWQRYASSSDKEWLDPVGSDGDMMKPGTFLANNSEWTHVTMTVTSPATTTSMQFALRAYGGATVAVANPMMVEGTGSGLSDAQAAKTGIYSANGSVYVLSDGVGTVEVYNLLGQLVRTEQVSDGCNELTGLDKGQVYVVRYGEKAQKVIL